MIVPASLIVMLTIWALTTVFMPLIFGDTKVALPLFNFLSAFTFLVWLVIFSGV